MAVTFVGSGNSGTSSSVNSFNSTDTPNYLSGDFVIVHACIDGGSNLVNTVTCTAPNGETTSVEVPFFENEVGGGSQAMVVFSFTATADFASSPGNLSIGWSGDARQCHIGVQAWRGADAIANATQTTADAVLVNDIPSGAFTSSQADGVITFAANIEFDNPDTPAPTGWTERENADSGAIGYYQATRDALTTASESVTSTNFPSTTAVVGYTGITYVVYSAGGTPTPDFDVQHGTLDVAAAGSTVSITPVASLDSAFVLNNNSRGISGGPNGSSASVHANDTGLLVELTATDTVTFTRDSNAAGTTRASWSVWEYIGDSGGPNEFIVRDRRTLLLNSGTGTSVSYTPTGISDATQVIAFVTGASSNEQTQNSHDHHTATAEVNRTTGEITVYSRGNAGATEVQVCVVEFTGSNWTVHYGTQQQDTDSFTMTLGSSVSSWDNTLLYTQFFKNGTSGSHDSLSDVTYTAQPNAALNQVDFQHNTNHLGAPGQRYVAYALENSDMNISRYTSTSSVANNVNIDITSAGLSTIDEALIFGTSQSSGGGTAHLRGTRNFQLTSPTQAQHYCHRSGNTMVIRMQVVELPQSIKSGGGITGSLSAQETGSDTFVGVGTSPVSGTLSGQESGSDIFTASGTLSVNGTLSAQETGSDTLLGSGTVTVSGTLSAQEVGSDDLSASGTVTSPGIIGTLSVQEVGTDTLSSAGTVEVSGTLVVQETGSDGATVIGVAPVSGVLSVQEVGDDTASLSGTVSLTGTLTAQEVGDDTLSASGGAASSGSLSVQEAGSDLASFSGTLAVSGVLSVQETGSDTATITGELDVGVTGTLQVQESGGAINAYLGSTPLGSIIFG